VKYFSLKCANEVLTPTVHRFIKSGPKFLKHKPGMETDISKKIVMFGNDTSNTFLTTMVTMF
jgi:hypothetical protein